jgi:hypothetical protein
VTVDQLLDLVALVLGAARRPNGEQRACLAHDPATYACGDFEGAARYACANAAFRL